MPKHGAAKLRYVLEDDGAARPPDDPSDFRRFAGEVSIGELPDTANIPEGG